MCSVPDAAPSGTQLWAIDEGAERLKDKINSLVAQERTQVVLNLAEASYIDSSGLGQLVACYGSLAGVVP